ncbi:MAG: DeoR family transcriptional regulator [Candidatus Humimicrobiaceae bacterium]
MLKEERQVKILQLIKDKGFIENKDLQEFFKVTRITIRREYVPVKQAMLKSSKYAILVADSSKYGKDAFCKVCGWSQINMVICGDKIPDEYINLFNDKNIDYRLPN